MPVAVNTAVIVNTVGVLAAVECVRAGVVRGSLIVVAGRGPLNRGRHWQTTKYHIILMQRIFNLLIYWHLYSLL